MRTALVIIPHADDAALFCGATIAKRVAQGWRVVIARITWDARDSVGLTLEESYRRNAQEFRDAAAALGVTEVVDMDYRIESLADVSEVELRGHMIYLFRKYRPYAVFTFDPYARRNEPNMDHVRAAQAVEEAFWMARFDLTYPEHFAEGLKPFAVCEQWYYARHPTEYNHTEDITEYMEQKIRAVGAHRTMIDNMMNQWRMLMEVYEGPVPESARNAFSSDPLPLLEKLLTQRAAELACAGGLADGRLAEVFRVTRFGDMAGLFEALGFEITLDH
jgi:LmbE family N-acetylglucosaminyl deacetylase